MPDDIDWKKRLADCWPVLEGARERWTAGDRDDLLPKLATDLAKPFEDVVPGLGLALKLLIGKSAVNRLLDRQIAEAKSQTDRTRFADDLREATEQLIADAVLQLSRTIVRTSEETQQRVARALAETHQGGARLREAVEALVEETRRAVLAPPPVRSTVPPSGALPFIGRATEMAALDALIGRGPGFVAALVGAPGVGKTELAYQFARRHLAAYPGGTFRIAMGPAMEAPPADLAALARTVPGREGVAVLPFADQCRAALAALGPARTLLIYDNAPAESAVLDWLPAHASGCDVLVTSTQTEWTRRFVTIRLRSLDDAQERQIVRELAGADVDRQFGEVLVRNAGGVTIQLCAATRAVARALRNGRRPPDLAAFFADETRASFRGVWRLMEPDVRALLQLAGWFDAQHVPEDLLAAHLSAQLGWEGERVDAAIADACDYAVLRTAAAGELRIHDLFARFVRAERANRPAVSDAVLEAHAEAFVQTAAALCDRPGDPELRRRLLSFPLALATWREDAAVAGPLRGRASSVGRALRELGLFRDAATWLEVAVGEADSDLSRAHMMHAIGECWWHIRELENDRHWLLEARRLKARLGPGARLGETLFMLGEYFWSRFDVPAAEEQYAAAVAAFRRDGQEVAIDHVALGDSLHAIGNCHLLVYEESDAALLFFEEALAEKQKGNTAGQPDPESLSRTLHQIGELLFTRGDNAAALSYFQQAAAEGERGDRYGRVDRASVGISMSQAGLCQVNLGDLDAAELILRRALELKRDGDVYGRIDATSVGRTLCNLAELRASQRRFEESACAMREAKALVAKGNMVGVVDQELVARYTALAEAMEARARQSNGG